MTAGLPENAAHPVDLTIEQMLALLARPGPADLAYEITETYEEVARIYDASLNVSAPGAAAATTNPR